jgi:NADPH2:quinone reductase
VLAAVCAAHGPPEDVRVEHVPSPELGPGQVRIAVRAAAVNFPDVLIAADRYQVSVPTPFVPGSELAGVVAEVAGDVTGVAVGDRVTATALVGAFAEEIVVAAASVAPIPDGVDDAAAAASGVAHRTAWHVLRSVARVQPGEELVVLGAGGGVGLAAVQLGALLGATVTAVASSAEKLAAAQAHGATHLVDHRTAGDLRQALKAVLPGGGDVVVDPVGGALAEPALRVLRWGGRFVTVGYASGEIPRIPLNLVLLKGVQVVGFEYLAFATHRPEEMAANDAELARLVVEGRARPHVGARFPLAEVAAALRLVADGRAVGKVVLDLP